MSKDVTNSLILKVKVPVATTHIDEARHPSLDTMSSKASCYDRIYLNSFEVIALPSPVVERLPKSATGTVGGSVCAGALEAWGAKKYAVVGRWLPTEDTVSACGRKDDVKKNDKLDRET
jgi:hypothetical protein